MFLLAAIVSLVVWIYLLAARGAFWRVSGHFARNPSTIPAKRIIAVIPARNEADGIASTVQSILSQTVSLEIILIDDASTDSTAQFALAAAEQAGQSHRLTVLAGKPLPPGWTGKLWALSQGVAHAESLRPDYLLFTDADIRHSPSNVAQLLALAEDGGYDVASHMVRLASGTTAEKALIPAFVFFFLMLYPPSWVRSRRHKTAGAAGGCVLIRASIVTKIGGIASICNQVIDDCALARRVKQHGGRVWLGLTAATESTRSYRSFAEIGRMISRTAFNQLGHSTVLLAGTVLGLFVTYLVPPLLLVSGHTLPALLGAMTWLLMSLAYLPMVRLYRLSLLWSLLLPPIALFYTVATLHSAVQYWRGRGGEWKGRSQDRS